MKMLLADVYEALGGMAVDAVVTVQCNVPGEEDAPGDEPSHTIVLGYVYSVFKREDGTVVLDCAVTDREL